MMQVLKRTMFLLMDEMVTTVSCSKSMSILLYGQMYVFSVMWHPTGDTSTVIGLTESHIVLWDLDTATSRVQVILYFTL